MKSPSHTGLLRSSSPQLQRRPIERPPIATLAVLVPGPFGFHLFVRWPRDRLRRSSTLVHPSDLADILRPLGDPLVVGLVGTRDIEFVADQVLDFADMVAVPTSWLRQVPRRDVRQRALVAARILTAHRAGPLRHYFGRLTINQQTFPF